MPNQHNNPEFLKDTPLGVIPCFHRDKTPVYNELSFWHKYEHKHLDKMIYRSIHLRNNSDYRIRYPNECKNVTPNQVHPDAKIRILKEHMQCLERARVPTVERPTRMNRNG